MMVLKFFNYFKPLNTNQIEIRRTTDSPNPTLMFFYSAMDWVCIQPSLNHYVAANYNGKWYFGLVRTVFHEEENAEILFLHPPWPAASFYWPQREDLCIIPLEHIISQYS